MDYELFLVQRDIKPTAMRMLVVRELERAKRPLSLKELEERMVTAERSTIFRVLTLFHEHHLVHLIEDGSGAVKYELCRGQEDCTLDDQHPHFYCERCQRTFCLSRISAPVVALPGNFKVHSINYVLKGLCPQCSTLHQD